MQFTMTHEFPCTPAMLWDIFQDEEFERRLEESSGVRREVLERGEDGPTEVTRINCISLRPLPAPMAKVLGSEHFEFEQVNRLNREENRLEWQVVPSLLKDRISAGGTTTIEVTPDGRSRRKVVGDFTVRVPIVGKRMEQKLAERIQESYERAAEIALALIKEREEATPA